MLRSFESGGRDWMAINDLDAQARFTRNEVVQIRHAATARQRRPNDAPAGGGSVQGPFYLKDVFDDYLVCNAAPTAPIGEPPIDPPLGQPRFIGTFKSTDFQGNDIILATGTTPTLYYPVRNDSCQENGVWYIFDGTDWREMAEAYSDVYIAKETRCRTSLVCEYQLGGGYMYTYSGGAAETWAVGPSNLFNVNRRAQTVSDQYAQNERITPPWTENEMLFAIPASTGVLTEVVGEEIAQPVTLLLVGRSAQWAGPS